MFRLNAALALCLGAGTLASPALAQYKFRTSAGPAGGAQIFEGVNQSKDLVAEVTTSSGNSSCNLIQGIATTPIADPNGSYTQCYGLSDRDEVVGFYIPNSNGNTLVGFTYEGGTYSDFLAQGSNATNGGTQLNAISLNGKVIAGTYADVNGYSIAFKVSGRKQTNIAISGADYLVATGVNNAGDVTVQSFDINNNILANYVIVGSTITQITYPGAPKTTVHGINDTGLVVGNFTNSAGVEQGFTYDVSAGTYSAAIADPKLTDTILIGINDKGLIAGGGITNKGTELGLVAQPTQ